MPFTKGHKINLGRQHSESTKEKISLAHLGTKKPWSTGQSTRGRVQSLEERQMRSIAQLGIKKGPISEQGRRNMSLAHKGKVPWNKGKHGFDWGLKGDRHPNWRGGVTSEYKKIRKSLEYIQWRTAVFERDAYTCQFCKEVGGRLNADHIKPFADYPKLRFKLSNGRTLCESCHRKTTTWGFRLVHNRKGKASKIRELYGE